MDAIEQFKDAIQAAGLTPPECIEPDGKLHRFASNGKRGDDAGWYVFHDDGIPAGSFGDWRTGLSETWRANIGCRLSPQEKAAHRARMDALRREREAEDAKRKTEARETAQAIWAAAPGIISHAYLERKHVNSYKLRLYRGGLVISGMPCDGCLIVPARDTAGVVHTLEFIHADARGGDNKRFLPGGDYKAFYFSIGKPCGTICVVEGFATGATVHEATGHAVAVAFSAGNLTAVALALRAKYPTTKIILCADNDRFTPGNPGVTKATEAARAVGGFLAVPQFEDVGPYDYYPEGRGHG